MRIHQKIENVSLDTEENGSKCLTLKLEDGRVIKIEGDYASEIFMDTPTMADVAKTLSGAFLLRIHSLNADRDNLFGIVLTTRSLGLFRKHTVLWWISDYDQNGDHSDLSVDDRIIDRDTLPVHHFFGR